MQLCDESSFGAVRNDSAKNIVDCIKQHGQLQVNQVRLLSTISARNSTAVERDGICARAGRGLTCTSLRT